MRHNSFKYVLLTIMMFVAYTTNLCHVSSTDEKVISLVIDGHLIGGFKNGQWLTTSEVLPMLTGQERYRIYSTDRFLADIVDAKSGGDSREDDYIKLNHPFCDSNHYTAISCTWNAMPRQVKQLSTKNETYIKIVKDILTGYGIKDGIPIKITQILKADIEGDGSDEVFIAANYHHDLYTLRNNDYAMLLVRKIVNGKVKNIVLEKEVIKTKKKHIEAPPVTYNLRCLLDVNGDGVLEMIMGTQYYEGQGFYLYQWLNGKMVRCLEKVYGE